MRPTLIADYAGHPFTYQLASDLDSRGVHATYCYCSTVTSPKASVSGRVSTVAVSVGREFPKYQLVRRLWSEIRFGVGVFRAFRSRPQHCVVCNMPIVSAALIWLRCRMGGTRFVVWFQARPPRHVRCARRPEPDTPSLRPGQDRRRGARACRSKAARRSPAGCRRFRTGDGRRARPPRGTGCCA